MPKTFCQRTEPPSGPEPDQPSGAEPGRHRLRRAIVAAAVSVLVLAGTVAGTGLSGRQSPGQQHPPDVEDPALTAAGQPVTPAATQQSMTVLLIAAQINR